MKMAARAESIDGPTQELHMRCHQPLFGFFFFDSLTIISQIKANFIVSNCDQLMFSLIVMTCNWKVYEKKKKKNAKVSAACN